MTYPRAIKRYANISDKTGLISKVIHKLLPKFSSRRVQEYVFPKIDIVASMKGHSRNLFAHRHGDLHVSSETMIQVNSLRFFSMASLPKTRYS